MCKKGKYIICLVALLCCMPFIKVNAEEINASCVYLVNEATGTKLTIEVTDSNIDVQLPANYSVKSSSLAQINFQNKSEGKWECPSKIYYRDLYNYDTEGVDVYLSAIEQDIYIDTYIDLHLIEEESESGKELSDEQKYATMSCKYGNLVITFNDRSFTHNQPCPHTNVQFDQNQLKMGRCPEKVYVGVYESSCSYSLEHVPGMEEVWMSVNELIPDASGTDDDGTNGQLGSYDDADEDVQCAILGKSLTPIIKWALRIIDIAIPILIIISTIVDFLGIVLSGEEKNFKEAGAKLVKRLIIGAVIIFLPMILTVIIDMSGILGQYGIEKDQLFCSLF